MSDHTSTQPLIISLPMMLERVFVPGMLGAVLALFLMNGVPAIFDELGRGVSFGGSLKQAFSATFAPASYAAAVAPITTIIAGFVTGVLVSLMGKSDRADA